MTRRSDPLRSGLVRVALALFAIALTYAMALAVLNGLADVYATPVKKMLQANRESGGMLAAEDWQRFHANLRLAQRIALNDPATLTELGRLHRIRLENETLDREASERHAKLAIDFYERAAALRPTWAWSWGSLALLRYELYQESGDAYQNALMQAAHFGPWEDRLQLLVTELGVDTLESLGPGAKRAVLGAIDRALEQQPADIIAVVKAKQAWQYVCRAVTDKKLRRLQAQCAELDLEQAPDLT